MPLNTELKGSSSSIREAADWLDKHAKKVSATGDDVTSARGSSEGAWHGDAGDGFRTVMTKAGGKIDGVAGDMHGGRDSLRTYADDFDTVKSRMDQARSVAHKAGLTVTANTIHEPGSAPAKPISVDDDSSAHQKAIHDRAVTAQHDYARKVKAYNEVSKTVLDARAKHRTAITKLTKFGQGQLEKAPFTMADVTTGLAGQVASRTSAYRQAAKGFQEGIDNARRYAEPRAGRSVRAQGRADALHIERKMAQQAKNDKALATQTAKMVDKLPGRVKKLLQADLSGGKAGEAAEIGNKFLRGSTKVAGKIPVVGLGITAASTVYDATAGDKSVGKSIASNGSSFVAGSLATAGVAAAGGPVGWGVAAGALAGAGVGFVVDEWGDDIADGVGNAASTVGHGAKKAAGAVGDFFGSIF